MTENATFLHTAGHLRPGVDIRRAADLMWTVTAPETIDLLVSRQGWSAAAYSDFVYETLVAGLLA